MTPTSDESVNPTVSPEVETGPLTAARFPNVKKSELRVADATATFIVPVAELTEVMSYLRNEGGFTMLEDLTAVDWKTEPRFQVVYNMICLERQEVLRVKVNLPGENPVIPTVTDIWPGANWYEREVFDLFGITFLGHPDLRRIEMPEDWEGHPLRKDYPMTGPRRPNLPSNQFRIVGRTTKPE